MAWPTFDGPRARLDAVKDFANGQCSERQAEELILKTESAQTTIARMQLHASNKTVRATCCVKFSARQPDGRDSKQHRQFVPERASRSKKKERSALFMINESRRSVLP
jgi:hypothetical protein